MPVCKTTNVEEVQETVYSVECDIPLTYTFEYCISYRDPALDERILARWIWNDEWIWNDNEVWQD